MLIPQGRDKELLKKIVTEQCYKELIDETFWLYKKYCKEDIKALKFSDYMLFYKTGSRYEYENLYFERRARLAALAVLCILYDNDEYIKDLEDTIWAICDEYSWALPAHINLEKGCDTAFIDLFAAETGFALSEIYYLLHEKLSFLVKERIKLELKRRIIQSFINNEYHWEKIENNWAAVCAGSVGAVFMYMEPDLFQQIEYRIENAIESFLKSYKADGVCREGHSYWNYGFGYFVYYASILREYTSGKKDYFKQSRIKIIAQFQQKTFLQGNVVASFSDSKIKSSYAVGLTHFLKEEYPNAIEIPDIAFRSDYRNESGDNCFRFAAYLRSFLWFNKDLCNFKQDINYYYMKESQWYINKKEAYAFAVKGGTNDEPHNHNDIGSFILAVDKEQCICDIGMGEYTKAYFDNTTRYKLICNSSLGHNVPIICGEGQMYGERYKGNIIFASKDEIVIDIRDAYNLDIIKNLKRHFTLANTCVILNDCYELVDNDVTITERFITKYKPEIMYDNIIINKLQIVFQPELCNIEISEKLYKNHTAVDELIYCVDFNIKKTSKKFNVIFKFNFL